MDVLSASVTKELVTVFRPSAITTSSVRREPRDSHLAPNLLDWHKRNIRYRNVYKGILLLLLFWRKHLALRIL